MRLSSLLQSIIEVNPDQDLWVSGLTQDSRHIKPGELFLALPGLRTDGREYIHQAIANGAAAVLYENDRFQPDLAMVNLPLLGLADLNSQLGIIAARFYGNPTQNMTVIGVTGTNGKTSISQFIGQALAGQNRQCAIIGTLGKGFLPNLNPTGYTTPDAVQLQKDLAEYRSLGAEFISMEVSSHSLSQQRVNGIDFGIAVFTNLTRDHLDYHHTMEAYGAAKAKLFEFPHLRHSIYNLDDAFGRQLLAKHRPPSQAWAYTAESTHRVDCPTVAATNIRATSHGFEMRLETPWGAGVLNSSLLGRFNISNLLAVMTVLGVLEIPFANCLTLLSNLQPVVGRMQSFAGRSNRPTVIVDYAHTPDALKQVLSSLREHHPNQLWCVFGCGGDRDPGKRSQMGAIADQLSDQIILTNDNPRSEDPEQIAKSIRAGMEKAAKAHIELDRAAAIAYAIESAGPNDIVLIAGKGHETEQIIGNQKLHFSDAEQVQKFLK